MSFDEFYSLVKPIIIKFGLPEGGEEAIKIDYDVFKIFSPDDFRQAVSQILSEYQYQSYPQQYVFFEKLNDILSSKAQTTDIDHICLGCLDSGIFFNPVTEFARFCNCEKGQRKREYFLVYRKTGNVKEAQKKAAELVVETKPVKEIYEKRFYNGKFTGFDMKEEYHKIIKMRLKKILDKKT